MVVRPFFTHLEHELGNPFLVSEPGDNRATQSTQDESSPRLAINAMALMNCRFEFAVHLALGKWNVTSYPMRMLGNGVTDSHYTG
jgi:hypothetical protein